MIVDYILYAYSIENKLRHVSVDVIKYTFTSNSNTNSTTYITVTFTYYIGLL